MEIYIIKDGSQFGPIALEELRERASELGLTPDTPVWYTGLPDWTPLRLAPETAALAASLPPQFNNPNATYAPGMPTPGVGRDDKPPMPDNYLVWSILSLVCCCLPFGIVSLVYSCRVSTLYYRGEYAAALEASQKAKNWAIASAISYVVIMAISIMLQLTLGIFGAMM